MNKIETHVEQKARHSAEFGEIEGLFFAFSNKQLEEGMIKIGLTMGDVGLITSIGMGGYIKKDKVKELNELFDRQEKERKDRLKDEKALIDALVYELGNHEYCITYDDRDTLESLGLKKEDISEAVLKKAKKIYLDNQAEVA